MNPNSTPAAAAGTNEWLWVGGATLALMIFGNIPLMGIPGAFFMELGKAVFRIDPEGCLGPSVWAGAIITTLVAPLGIPLGYAMARLLYPDSRPGRVLITLAVFLVWGFAFASWVYINAQNEAAKRPPQDPATRIGTPCKPWRWPYGAGSRQ